jgi:hypothetical protein
LLSAGAYDAIIVPNDLGYDVSCTIEEENRQTKGMLYTYHCSAKTPSFDAAIKLRDRLVQGLSDLHFKEDEVREHGLAADARDKGVCAPSGECLFQHVYATATRDWKFLQIEADPSFTVTVMAAVMAKSKGIPPTITGIDNNSGRFSFDILSVGPQEEH